MQKTFINIIRVAVLEDNPIDSLHISLMLSKALGNKYEYKIVGNFESLKLLLDFIAQDEVDVILSDIFANQVPMGLELLKRLQFSTLPIILMTNSQDKSVYVAAQEQRHINYIIKPFHAITLQSIIDTTFDEYLRNKQHDFMDKKFIYLSGRAGQKEQVLFDNIIYLESDLNDCFVYTNERKYVLKKSLSKMCSEKLDERFIRVHQKYVANKKYIKTVSETNILLVSEMVLPVGKSFKKPLLKYLKNIL